MKQNQLTLFNEFDQTDHHANDNSPWDLTFEWANMPVPRDPFSFLYLSDQWRRLRYEVLSSRGNNCECCGHSWSVGNPLQVDHIKPKSLFPRLALERTNLQILCRECNMGKSNTDQTDWRRAA